MPTDQDLWKTLKDIQKTIKRWEKVKRRLPTDLQEEAHDALYTELLEATDTLQTHINDALSQEIRASVFDMNALRESLNKTAILFIQNNQLKLAQDLIIAESELPITKQASIPKISSRQATTSKEITTEQVEVIAKLVEIGEEDSAREICHQLLASRQTKVSSNRIQPTVLSQSYNYPSKFEKEQALKRCPYYAEIFIIKVITTGEGISSEWYMVIANDKREALNLVKEEVENTYSGDWTHKYILEK